MNWDQILDTDIDDMHDMLDILKKELAKQDGEVAFEFLKPLKYMMCEAVRDVIHHRELRVIHGETILGTMDEEC